MSIKHPGTTLLVAVTQGSSNRNNGDNCRTFFDNHKTMSTIF